MNINVYFYKLWDSHFFTPSIINYILNDFSGRGEIVLFKIWNEYSIELSPNFIWYGTVLWYASQWFTVTLSFVVSSIDLYGFPLRMSDVPASRQSVCGFGMRISCVWVVSQTREGSCKMIQELNPRFGKAFFVRSILFFTFSF